MIRVKDKHVVMIVDDTLSGACEVTNDMYKRARCTGSVEPSLSQGDCFE